MGGRRLTLEDRKKIEDRWLAGDSIADIAACVGAHCSTIYLEMKRGGYSAELAQKAIFTQRHH